MKKQTTWLKLCLLGSVPVVMPLALQAQDEPADDDIFELSPFVVAPADNEGYRAGTTLAGSRVRSNVRDLGASISIATEEFMGDVGSTDGESLLQYVGSAEVGGVLGNFSNVQINDNSSNNSRINPQDSQRVRGLSRAILTRDYFQTRIPFDSYNTSRVTVNRGPNSILFGLGSPGGVINNTTNRPSLSEDFGEFSVRFDRNGGHRETFKANRVVVEDRLAVNVAAMNEKVEFRQKPAFENDKRFFISADSVLFQNDESSFLGKTTLRGSYEVGEIVRNPPDVLPPRDGFSSWWEGYPDINSLLEVAGLDFSDLDRAGYTEQDVINAVSAGLVTVPDGMTVEEYAADRSRFVPQGLHDDRFSGDRARDFVISRPPYFIFPAINFDSGAAGTGPGFTDPDLSGIEGIMARWRRDASSSPGINRVQDLYWTRDPFNQLGGEFSSASIQDRNVFDYHKRLLQGDTNRVSTDFDVSQIVFNQDFFDGKAGFELAYDRQVRELTSFTPLSFRDSKQISIDITTHQAPGDSDFDGVADRLPNENLGRPVVRWGDTDVFDDNFTTYEKNEQETLRATAYATIDLKERLDSKLGSILGSHTFTGLYEDKTNDNSLRVTSGVWWADNSLYPGSPAISNGDNDNFRRKVKAQIYLGPDTRGLSDPSQVRIDDTVNIRLPQIGDTYDIWYFNNATDEPEIAEWRIIEAVDFADLEKRELESTAITWQANLFDDHIKGMYAIRNDKSRVFSRLEPDVTRTLPSTDPDFDPNDIPLLIDTVNATSSYPLETSGNFNEAQLLRLQDEPLAVDDDTTTWHIVARYPEGLLGELPWGMDLYGHYYEGESFIPASGDVNLLNERLPNITGVTEEYGFTVELFESKLSLRFNWYETSSQNNRGGGVSNVVGQLDFWLTRITEAETGGIPLFADAGDLLLQPDTDPSNLDRSTGTDADIIGVTTYEEYYQAIIDLLPAEIQSIYNYRVSGDSSSRSVDSNPLDGDLASTFDFVSKGLEIDVVGSLTPNWSISLNVAQQETVRSNSVPVALDLVERINANVQASGFAKSRRSPFQGSNDDTGDIYNNITNGVRAVKALDGTPSDELREWRVNLFTRYQFNDGAFDGLTIGGGLRYQDEVAIGNPLIFDPEFPGEDIVIPDVDNPYLGPDELNGDLFISYERPLNDKVDWKVQLNARNLYRKNGSDDIPIHANPDGYVALIRIPPEQQFFLTNTFSF